MIPPISPPTDNLYKLIALFGLGIFILGIVNYTIQSEKLTETKIQIEYVEKQIIDTIYYYNPSIKNEQILFVKTSNYEDISKLIKQLGKDDNFANNNNLPFKVASFIDTEIGILKLN